MTFDLYAFQYSYCDTSYEVNAQKLLQSIEQTSEGSFCCASELCLTNFSYAHMDKAAQFSQDLLSKIVPLTQKKTLALSIIEKKGKDYINCGKILHDGQIVHSQAKHRLFPLGEEFEHFKSGDQSAIQVIKIGDIKVAMLICFELRFPLLWEQIRGADVIFIPALWGKARKEHLETLSRALAIINQCYVIVSNSTNDDMASSSSIISPMGEQLLDDSREILHLEGSLKSLQMARRYIDMNKRDTDD